MHLSPLFLALTIYLVAKKMEPAIIITAIIVGSILFPLLRQLALHCY